jgi:hypothetical protein
VSEELDWDTLTEIGVAAAYAGEWRKVNAILGIAYSRHEQQTKAHYGTNTLALALGDHDKSKAEAAETIEQLSEMVRQGDELLNGKYMRRSLSTTGAAWEYAQRQGEAMGTSASAVYNVALVLYRRGLSGDSE